MASIYTDEAREARYGKLRIKRNRCEKWLGWIMWAILLIGALSLIPGFVDGLLGGLFRGELFTFFGFLFSVVNFCAAVYAVYAKKWQHTIAAIVLIAVLGAITASINYKMAASTFNIIPLIPTFFIDRVWAELEKEEGFPLFDISYAEREERRRNMEKLTEARALRAGYRVAQTEQTSDMSDLLDSGRDAPVMAAHPRGYHDRYQDSQQITEPFQGIRSGVMDTLEDIGGEVIVVSQFTLYADTAHGRRPDFRRRPGRRRPSRCTNASSRSCVRGLAPTAWARGASARTCRWNLSMTDP